MLTISGPEQGDEYAAAVSLGELIREWNPNIAGDPRTDIRIVAGAKCYGQKREDIDVLLFASFGVPIVLPGRANRKQEVYIYSICAAIEVKGHQADRIRFRGNQLEVYYSKGFSNVSEQSLEQKHSVKNFIDRQGIDPPYVLGLIWLPNVPRTALPEVDTNVISGTDSWLDIVELCFKVDQREHRPPFGSNRVDVRAARNERAFPRAADLFSQELKPSPLDRKKMEAITARTISPGKYGSKVGEQLLIFRGRGGTGKTVNLLQLAYQLYQDENDRVLVLTYNRALASDIRRLLALLHVKDDVAEQSISIQTVYSFIYDLLDGLGVIPEDCDDYLERYDEYKAEGLEILQAAEQGDMDELIMKNTNAFNWDYIFVDEAQDWPADEREILYKFYNFNRFVIADGVDQFVRTQKHSEWRESVNRQQTEVVPLRASLRLKSTLADFAQAFAKEMGLNKWFIETNLELYGGNVIVTEGDFLQAQAFNNSLIKRNSQSGNKPVDMLYCVPPKLVRHTDNGIISSFLGERFEDWGLKVWDGAADEVREVYPTDLDQLRIVQYDSCRGLEGWTVVCLEIDEFYKYKYEAFAPTLEQEEDSSFDRAAAAHEYAAGWLMIPLTRAIDTLVLHVASPNSLVANTLRRVKAQVSSPDDPRVQWGRV